MPSGFFHEKEQLVKETQTELAKLTISTLTKRAFTHRFEKVIKDMVKEQKEIHKIQVDAAVHLVKIHFEQNEANSTFFVSKLSPKIVNSSSSTSAKVVMEVIKHVSSSSKYRDKSVYFFFVDDTTGKVALGCYVSPKHMSKGLVASEWTEQVTRVVGGKAGGKGSTSVGTGTDVSKVDEGVEVAVKYVEKLI